MGKVAVLWTVFHPADARGNRLVVQRTAKRITWMLVDRDGEIWSTNPLRVIDRGEVDYAFNRDFRAAMKPEDRSHEPRRVVQLLLPLPFPPEPKIIQLPLPGLSHFALDRGDGLGVTAGNYYAERLSRLGWSVSDDRGVTKAVLSPKRPRHGSILTNCRFWSLRAKKRRSKMP